MGTETKILLTSAPNVLDILKFASETWRSAALRPFGTGVNAYWLEFIDGEDHRQLSLHPPGECASDYADVCASPAVYMSMGKWGNSEAIARRFAVRFGGMVMPDDSSDDWQSV